MNMFARFDENPAMTLRVIKETKRPYGVIKEKALYQKPFRTTKGNNSNRIGP